METVASISRKKNHNCTLTREVFRVNLNSFKQMFEHLRTVAEEWT